MSAASREGNAPQYLLLSGGKAGCPWGCLRIKTEDPAELREPVLVHQPVKWV